MKFLCCFKAFTGRTPQSGVSRYLNLLSGQESTFCPLAEKKLKKNYELDRKMVDIF